MDKTENNFEIFSWLGLELYQDDLVHKIGTDAILLGSWIPKILQQPNSLLDAGTGTGILALMLAKAYPETKVTAVDIDEHALLLARRNIAETNFEDRVVLKKEDMLEMDISDDAKFDLVVSNPPYYKTHNPSKSDHKKLAKHSRGPVKDWMYSFLKSTESQGHCCVIVPTNSAEQWISAANENKFYNTNRLDVYSFANDHQAVRSLLHFHRNLQKPIISKLTLYNKDNSYTVQYLEFSGIAKEGSEKTNR